MTYQFIKQFASLIKNSDSNGLPGVELIDCKN